jgi:hypothetical protein
MIHLGSRLETSRIFETLKFNCQPKGQASVLVSPFSYSACHLRYMAASFGWLPGVGEWKVDSAGRMSLIADSRGEFINTEFSAVLGSV